MTELNPLSSPQWHRVADLLPALSREVEVARVWLRGQRWYVLHHREHGQRCRLNQQAYGIAARMDGQRSVDQLWHLLDEAAHQAGGQEPPSQDDLIDVLALLNRHHLLSFDKAPDFGTLLSGSSPTPAPATAPDEHPTKPKNSILSWRLPLGDPSAWLDRHAHWAQRLYSWPGLMLWLALLLTLASSWLLHGPALKVYALTWMATPSHVMWSLLLYPPIKAIHEGAHALAVRRWGGQVHDCGITLMMGMPVPYVDASAAHSFAQPWQRVVVSAAGIMAELTLAALGLLAWIATDSGWLHQAGFVTWFIACTSTLLFNGNPLQRLDGYHVMTDAWQLPNLAARSQQWWQRHLQQWVLGPPPQHDRLDTAPPAKGERPWLWGYAPMAWLYQLVLWSSLSLWAGSVSAPLGWALACWSLWRLCLLPMQQWARLLWQSALSLSGGAAGLSAPAFRRLGWSALALLVVLAVPMPDRTVVQGIVSVPEQALVRPEVDGFVDRLLRPEGHAVKAGDALLTLHNPRLLAQRDGIAAQLARAQQTQFAFMTQNGSKAGQAQDEITQLQAQLDRLDEQMAALTVRANRPGRLVWPKPADMPGRYLHQGEGIGHVLDDKPARVRIALAQDDAGDVSKVNALQTSAAQVSVRLSDPRGAALAGHLIRDSIGATRTLPSAALSDAMGGDIATDPKDDKHLRSLRPVVLMDVQLNQAVEGDRPRLGERAWVRLDHGWAPWPWQAARWAYRQTVRAFNPQQ